MDRSQQRPLTRQQRRALARRARKSSVTTPMGFTPAGAALVLGALASAHPAAAATFTVSNLNDSSPGSLRQAIADANGAAGADVVAFQAGLTGTITLATGQLPISDAVDVQGPGAAVLTVDGNNASRVFYIYSPAAPPIDVTISGLTLTGGNDIAGGAIIDVGEHLTLDRLTVSNNTASAVGGGVAVGGDTAQLTITSSLFSGNSAVRGGGIYLYDSGAPTLIQDTVIQGNQASGNGGGAYFYGPSFDVTIERCTISGNHADGAGGGIYFYDTDGGEVFIRQTTISGNDAGVGGGAYFYAIDDPVLIENSTISGNQATEGAGGGLGFYTGRSGIDIRHSTIAGNTAATSGGGVYIAQYGLTLENSIVADNTAGSDNDLSGEGTFYVGHSLVESPGGATIVDNGGNITGQDPQLGPLANNGGPTQTQRPAGTSPVIDAGDPAFAGTPTTDQRGTGFPRLSGPAIDMGAVELNPGTIQLSVATATVGEAAGTITITATRTGGTDGAVGISYTTNNGSAVAPGDFATTAGTLNWADQDGAPKTFQVTIVDDALMEGDETFTVVLSAPTGGATLGATATETVTIQDDDTAIAAVPTLGDAGKLLLAGVLGAAGILLLRRRKGLAAPAVILSLALGGAAASASAAPAEPSKRAPRQEEMQVVTLSREQLSAPSLTLRLKAGGATTVPTAEVEIVDRRHHRHHGLPAGDAPGKDQTLDADQPAIVKVKHNPDGSIKKVKVLLFDSLQAAQAALKKKSE